MSCIFTSITLEIRKERIHISTRNKPDTTIRYYLKQNVFILFFNRYKKLVFIT